MFSYVGKCSKIEYRLCTKSELHICAVIAKAMHTMQHSLTLLLRGGEIKCNKRFAFSTHSEHSLNIYYQTNFCTKYLPGSDFQSCDKGTFMTHRFKDQRWKTVNYALPQPWRLYGMVIIKFNAIYGNLMFLHCPYLLDHCTYVHVHRCQARCLTIISNIISMNIEYVDK